GVASMNKTSAPILVLLIAILLPPAPVAALTLSQDRMPTAVIVTADQPTAVARYAAQEFASHVEQATGVRLVVATESNVPPGMDAYVYIGDSLMVRAAGIDRDKLPAEAFVLRSTDNRMYIAGDDKPGDPLDPDTRAGTLWGVY